MMFLHLKPIPLLRSMHALEAYRYPDWRWRRPGLNSVIKSVVYRSGEAGWEVIGIRRGWEGLTHVDLQDRPAAAAIFCH